MSTAKRTKTPSTPARKSQPSSKNASRTSLRSAGVGRPSVASAKEKDATPRPQTPKIEENNEQQPPTPLQDPEPEPVIESIPEPPPEPPKPKEYPLPLPLLRKGLKDLGKCPDSLRHAYLKLSLPNENLGDIAFIKHYPYLVDIELSGNGISDDTPLGALRYLTRIDLSHNALTSPLLFAPAPYALHEADISYNRIEKIGDLKEHRFLAKLCLDRNMIREIEGLTQLQYLTHLSLRCNGISRIGDGLRDLPLKFLDLSRNSLTSLSGLESLTELEEFYVSNNDIQSLDGVQNLRSLTVLDIASNPLCNSNSPNGMKRLTTLMRLETLNMESRMDRLAILFMLPDLTILDGTPVSVEEKVESVNLFDPPMDVVASVQHTGVMTRSLNRPPAIREVARGFIVLTGCKGVGKRKLSAMLCKRHPELFEHIKSYTTRRPARGETIYNYVTSEEMQQMLDRGDFVQVCSLFGEMYGIAWKDLENWRNGKIGVIEVEIEGVLALKRVALNAIYVHIVPPDEETLRARLDKHFAAHPRATSDNDTPVQRLEHVSSMPILSGLPALTHGGSYPILENASEHYHTGSRPDSATVPDTPTNRWLAKYMLEVKHVAANPGLLDCTIVCNDGEEGRENAYTELEAYCLRVWSREE
ncbi:hypothetical protein BC832DRAFT_548527 [Gaertneriomyces semiglobifer]|nr:hypothetical protein BC832DRAFT_548527 [Gaertneriomyces semiglobifer]